MGGLHGGNRYASRDMRGEGRGGEEELGVVQEETGALDVAWLSASFFVEQRARRQTGVSYKKTLPPPPPPPLVFFSLRPCCSRALLYGKWNWRAEGPRALSLPVRRAIPPRLRFIIRRPRSGC